jgi:hypothetical protein
VSAAASRHARAPSGSGRIAALLRAPLSRLLACGALLALALHAFGAAPSPGSVRTVAGSALGAAAPGERTGSDDDLLYRTAAAAVSVDDPVVRGRLLRLAQYLDMGGTAEEADDDLVAAARDVGLAGEDVVLRRYLAELARLALAQPSATDLPSEDELRAWVASHAERFTAPARVRARQVYVSATRHGAHAPDDAAALLDELRRRDAGPDAGTPLGDPFARGPVIDGTHDTVARAFGEELARALDTLPAGSWQGPVRSPFGLHLVWIEQRTPAYVPPFADLRGRALHAYLRDKGTERAQSRMALLRCRASGGEACAE